MRSILRNRQLFAAAPAIIVLVIIVYLNNFNGLINNFSDSGSATLHDLDDRISNSTYFIESMTTLGNKYFENGGAVKDSEYFSFLNYDADSNEYNMDWVKGTEFAEELGNITGVGEIPESGIDRREINLALSFNDYFSSFYKRLPEIAWMYYTSESGFINMYPWVSSKEFKYSEDLKSVPFYVEATPEYNILRKAVWTPVYLDAAGKGLMVTLSSPIYMRDDFKGVISIDFTTNELNKILTSNYTTYLVDDEYSVISMSEQVELSSEVTNLKQDYGFSDSDLAAIDEAEYDKTQTAGNFFIYKAKVDNAPWTFLLVTSKSFVIGKSLLLTMPEIIIGILLLFSLFVLINLRKKDELLKNASLTDPLTGLNNRRFLDAAIETEIARAERYSEALSMVTLDLDRFKRVNDTWGHPLGDEVLKLVANTLKKSIRTSDVLVRVGGEEFTILLPKTDINEAYEMAERARNAIEHANHPIVGIVTASFGVAERLTGESYNSLYNRVDAALYIAKDSGRNCVVAFGQKADEHAVNVKIAWNTAWECGETTIDMQHRELLELGNELFRTVQSDPKDSSEQLDAFIKKISDHFEYEEHIQTEIGYPEAETHTKLHKKLVEQALELKKDYLNKKTKSSLLLSFVVDEVIVGHLMQEDTKFFPYVAASKK